MLFHCGVVYLVIISGREAVLLLEKNAKELSMQLICMSTQDSRCDVFFQVFSFFIVVFFFTKSEF